MLDTKERKEIEFFTGVEVEHTICYGMNTLFVVGIQSVKKILKLAEKSNCKHVYFGTSQSFNPVYPDDWKDWDKMIAAVLKEGYWVSLDFDVSYATSLHEYGWNEFEKFVPMISVKLPNIRLYNYNATLKIDDNTWGDTNPGVWTHHLNSLLTKDKYTHWDQYTNDEELK